MKPTANQIAEQLRGTSNSLLAVLEGHDAEELQDDIAFCHALDSLVFECVTCGWWHEQSEMADRDDGEWICEECNDEKTA